MTRAAICRALATFVAGFAVGGGSLLAQQPAPSAERLAALAKQLDANEFLARETATTDLLKAGPAALPALRGVLQHGSLEATSRAFYVVRELGLASHLDQGEEAWNLLSELAARKEVPTIARRATQALAELTQQRSAQALAELERLGAKIERSEAIAGILLDNPVSYLEIGPAFRGQVQDLSRLKWVAEVPQVIFTGEQVTDAWIKPAAAMAALTELHLYRTQVTDAGLAALADHANLEQLGLYYTPISDAALAPLAKLPSLRFLKLYGTKATAQRVAEFKEATALAIDFRRGAFLGVGCTPIDGTCRISSIHLGSPAEKAGLQEDDVIVRYGQSQVTTFDTLTNLIRQHADTEEVELEVTRRSFDKDGIPMTQNVVAKVKFTPWEMKAAVQQPPPR